MPEYRFSEKERDMCDSLAQIWVLAENKNLHFKDVKDAEKPEVLSELIEKQRRISGWLHDVGSKNENRQDAWEHLQEVGGVCRNYLTEMQNVKRIKEENLAYAGAQPDSVRSASRLIRGSSRAKTRSDEFISAFTDMVDQANQYGFVGPEEEIRIQQNLQSYRKAIVHKGGKAGVLPRPFRSTQDEMDRFSAEFDPDVDREMEHLEKNEKEPVKGNIPPVPEEPGPVKVEEVPDDNYQRLREAQERVRVQHQREEEAIRAENARLKAEAERIRAQQKREEHEKWVQHEKEEEEVRAMNARLKAEAERIKNAQQKAEREKQEQQRKAGQEKQKVGQEKQAQQKKAPGRQPQRNLKQEAAKRTLEEEKMAPAGPETSGTSYHPVRAPRMQAVQGLMNRLQYSEQILRNVAARLDWMERNPMGPMSYAPLMNSFQRSMAVPVFQTFVQYQDMQRQPNAQTNWNPQMGHPASMQRPQMWQPVQGQNPYMYSQPVQNQNPYMYSQPVQNQNPYMYSQPMQNQNPFMYSYPGMDRQREQMQMAYMLQNMSLVRLALTYASISIMETYNQIKDWLSERGKQKSMSAELDMQAASNSREREGKEPGKTKALSRSSEKRQISFKDLEKQEFRAMGKEEQKKIPMTMERNPLTRQKEKGMAH